MLSGHKGSGQVFQLYWKKKQNRFIGFTAFAAVDEEIREQTCNSRKTLKKKKKYLFSV